MNVLLPHLSSDDGHFWSTTWPAFLARAPLAPFAEETLDFLDAFSKGILLDPALRTDPAFAALAHWSRQGHLRNYARRFTVAPGRTRAARGVVLHLAPANVDTLFAYSWFTALLCGNLNVVRVSGRSLPVIAPLLQVLRGLFAEPRFAAVADRTLLINYEHDDAETTRLSAACHARLIWGGDETVRTIRALPLPATAVEIAFADRFSLAAFAASPLATLSEVGLERLAENFYNDAFQFGQKACASPRAVVLIGDGDACRTAAERFWSALTAVVRRKHALPGDADGIARLSTAMAMAATAPDTRVTVRPDDGGPPLVLRATTWPAELRTQHDGAGLFIQLELPDLAALAPLLTPHDQTLVAAGFTEDELRTFAGRLPARTIDRIVAPGRALDFDPTAWDGHDLFSLLSREIALS